jgi:hypothetical protein
MERLAQPTTERSVRLLAAHIDSLDPKAVPARERLELQLGTDLTHKLLFALAPQPARPASCAVVAA